MTRAVTYPIPRCDDAVMYGFGAATLFIVLDAFSGYHQVKLSPTSVPKTAFHAPYGRKYVWLVMPFGLRNAPAVFVAMMHDLQQLWNSLAQDKGLTLDDSSGSRIIIDDVLLFSVSEDSLFLYLECVCMVA